MSGYVMLCGYVMFKHFGYVMNHLVQTSVKLKKTKPFKCDILLFSRILWYKRTNPSLKNGDYEI